ncbi:1,4-alpha-glucan-branching protein [Euhalothece natronophila Z-M001]|uniref:1,4-alpha-glucan branching enzyme n=1 Tax=Euhalothece natronophila Z-M001 TaxID=522448 RepID=A0A5B8NJ13_9CHRO|nr:alpha-amylase family glycosyl hydrolase [Euhalothece natronophila]QDZ38966.1 1,4-alpha-glucan-branching protein [Euhalothece natronophila Z-M001]
MDFISLWLAYQLSVVSPSSDLATDSSKEEVQFVFNVSSTQDNQADSTGKTIKFNLSPEGESIEEGVVDAARSLQLAFESDGSGSFWSGFFNTLKQGVLRVIEAVQQLIINVQESVQPSSSSEETTVKEIIPKESYALRYLGIEDINRLTGLSATEINDFAPMEKKPVVSPDVKSLHLASVEKLEKEPEKDIFDPQVGTKFHEDGSVTLRVLVGNDFERLHVIGDFNNWGDTDNLAAYTLQPTEQNPHVHAVTLPPNDYHKKQYRLVDQDGEQRVDLGATLLSTPAFNERFYEDQKSHELNSVFWNPTPIPEEERAPTLDLRGKQLTIAETDVLSLAMKWQCQNPDSDFYGDTGEEHIPRLYNFVRECGLPEAMAKLGYNTVEFMPLDTHVDFWEPGAEYLPDWRYSYQTISFYGKHPDFGSPDELRQMVNAFHKSDVAVLLDVVYSHYSPRGNNPPREFAPAGFSQYVSQDGGELYGAAWTEWGTRRFNYTPEIRKNLIDAGLVNLIDYGFDGLRIDNVNGIDAQPYGREFLKELTAAVDKYRPQSVVIGEGYFGDPYLNRSRDNGGAGLLTTYSDRFYLWFTENLLKYVDEIDTRKLDYMLSEDWPLAMLYYPGNHDEFANPGNPFQARGRYLADAIDGGEHNQKIRSWSALTLFASSYYLDMFQLWTMQEGNLNSNAPINWSKLTEEEVAQMVQFQGDMKRFFRAQPAFAPYNMHRNMLHWVDHENKVVTFERIDFETGQRVYAVTNLGDHEIENYKIPVFPEDAKFEVALDSDRAIYGGEENNPKFIKAADHEVEFSLDAYGVVGLVQADGYQPEPTGDIPAEEPIERPRFENDFFYNTKYRP